MRDPKAHPDQAGPRRSYLLAGTEQHAPALPAGLYPVATPIGNLRDITLRAIETLAAVDLIACEDTRVTRKLVDHFGFTAPLTPYHDHNAEVARPKLLAAIAGGRAVALVSDAGTPLISDPGYKLVRDAREAGLFVTAIPGPSAVLDSLMLAALPTDRFTFEGFLPIKATTRQERLAEMARSQTTLVLFESGPRLADTLAELAAALGTRDAAICRELTKLFEEVRRGDLASLAAGYAQEPPPRGEIVIVVGPPAAPAALGETEIDAMLQEALARASVKDAVAEIASVTGRARKDVYRRALALRSPDNAAAR